MNYLSAITAAFKMDLQGNNKIVAAAQATAAAHPRLADITPEIETAIKAAIANALPKADYALYSADKKMARDDFSAEQKAGRTAANKYVSNAFKRLIGYAYPATDSPVEGGDKAEGEGAAAEKSASEADKWAKRLSDLIAQAQKATPEGVDVAGFVAALKTARTFVTLNSAE